MNDSNGKLENLKGGDQHDQDALDNASDDKKTTEKLADKVVESVKALMEKDNSTYDEATKALEISNPELFEAHEKAMSQ